MMRIYISGKVTGDEDNAKTRFDDAVQYLQKRYPEAEIVNPLEVNSGFGKYAKPSHAEYMKISFALLDMCNGIYMIEGWEDSKGANQEYGYAKGRKYIFVE